MSPLVDLVIKNKQDMIIIYQVWSLPNQPLTTGLNEDFALWQILSLIFCGIVVAILKMGTGRNFAMSGINSGHHNLPTYEISLKSNNVEFVRYCGGHFENGDR
jgi:hypothetical protein